MTHTQHETLSDSRTAPLGHNPQTLHALHYEPNHPQPKYHIQYPDPDQPSEISPPPNDPEATDRDYRPLGSIPKNSGAFFDPLPSPATGHPPRATTTPPIIFTN